MRWFRRKPKAKVIKFGEAFILDLNGRHIAMVVSGVNITKDSPTYGTISTLDHFMVEGDSRA